MPPTHKKGARITKRISMATAYWQLIDITGNPVNQGGSTETVQLRVGKSGYPPEQGVAQLGAEALRGDRGDILANQGAEQADRDDSEHRPAHPQNIAGVPLGHAFIDDTGHQQRQIELKHRLRQLGERSHDALPGIGFQEFRQFTNGQGQPPPVIAPTGAFEGYCTTFARFIQPTALPPFFPYVLPGFKPADFLSNRRRKPLCLFWMKSPHKNRWKKSGLGCLVRSGRFWERAGQPNI